MVYFIAAFLVFGGWFGCASQPKQISSISIHQLVPSNLRIRLPNERAECETLESLFKPIPLDALRQCIAGLSLPIEVSYWLRREDFPYFLLDDKDSTPECLKKTLMKIPVPREIIFQADEKLECYISKMKIDADRWMGIRLPMKRVVLKIKFPLIREPRDDGELARLLGAWALTVFNDEAPGAGGSMMRAEILPDYACKKCLGEKNMFGGQKPAPIFWP